MSIFNLFTKNKPACPRDKHIQIKIKGKWKDTKFSKIRCGDTFRIYEQSNVKRIDSYGRSEWIARTSARNSSGNYYVTVDEFTNDDRLRCLIDGLCSCNCGCNE